MPYTVRVEREVYHPQHTHNVQHKSWFEPVSHQRAASLPRFADHFIQSDSDSQDSAAGLGTPQQRPQLIRAIQRPQAPLSAKSKSQPIEPMETKTQTIHTVTIGRVEIGGGRIVAICETSGDSVTLEVPYGAVTEAVEKYLTDRLTRWDRDRIVTMLTDVNRAEDVKAESK